MYIRIRRLSKIVRGGVRRMSRSSNLPQPVFHTACCIIPPESLWGPIQDIRKRKDKAYDRWPPHVNLLFPFWDEKEFTTAAGNCVV